MGGEVTREWHKDVPHYRFQPANSRTNPALSRLSITDGTPDDPEQALLNSATIGITKFHVAAKGDYIGAATPASYSSPYTPAMRLISV